MDRREPIFNVPPSVTCVLGVLVAVHLGLALLPIEWDHWLTLALAFVPARYVGYAGDLPGGDIAAVTSFATHMLVHGNFAHLGINSAWLLAFGGAMALRVGGLRFLGFSIVCGVCGALAFLLVNWGALVPMVGISGAVAGLMAGVFRFFFSAIDHGGIHLLRTAPQSIPLMPLRQAVQDRRVLLATAIWLAVNAFAALGLLGLGSDGEQSGGIAWEAHLGGYAAGMLVMGAFDLPRRSDSQHPQALH